MKYVVANRRFTDSSGEVIISYGQRLLVLSETDGTYELNDGDGGIYNVSKNTMDAE